MTKIENLAPCGGFYVDPASFKYIVSDGKPVLTLVNGGSSPSSGYLPLTGGRMTGPLVLQDGGTAISNLGVTVLVNSAVERAVQDLSSATTDTAGLVKSSSGLNSVSVLSDGTMQVNEVSITKIEQSPSDNIIMHGGTSANI